MSAGSGPWTEPGVYEVAPGVHRIPLPLPGDALRAVNVYAIADGDGLVLVDSGWALAEARDLLEKSINSLGHDLGDIRRFLVTHAHRDHYTMAVLLRQTFGTKVALGIGEQPSMERILAARTDDQLNDIRRWGAKPLADILELTFKGSNHDPKQYNYEAPDEWLDGTVDVALADRTLRAVPTPGHTNGHVVFVAADQRLLFAGDHVLPHITPSIGFEPARARRPLGDYLDSLRLVRGMPDMRLLPAHGPVTDSVHGRVDELLAHHERRLVETLAAIADGAGSPYEAAHQIGWTSRNKPFADLDMFNQILATGETAAHLDVLVDRGLLTSSDNDGVTEYAVSR
jgi:glyoxylase-like metal-dependent hydrolase (beta-lactamase superfamily II)